MTTRRAADDVVSVTLCGDINGSATCLLRHALVDAIMRQRAVRILIDLREATFLDAGAIGALLAAVDAADDLRLDLTVCNPNPDLAAQLATTGLRHRQAA